MPIIIQQRSKCIGCNYCVEQAPEHWRMSKKDGKATLIGAIQKKEFWSLKIQEAEKEKNVNAAKACPVKIIDIR